MSIKLERKKKEIISQPRTKDNPTQEAFTMAKNYIIEHMEEGRMKNRK